MSHEKTVRLAVKFRFLRIPAKWSIKKNARGERIAVPHVDNPPQTLNVTEIDGWELRRSFLQLKNGNGKAAFRFLQKVGVWRVRDPRWTEERASAGEPGQFLNGYFGSRLVQGEMLAVSRDQLQKQAQWWNESLLNRSALKKEFGSPPAAASAEIYKYLHAWNTASMNELPMHIEWHGAHACAVVETVTGWEMLTATTHLDLLRGAKMGICQRKDCAIAFPKLSKHRKKYCDQKCAHLMAVRADRKRKEKKSARAKNGGGDNGDF